MTEKLMKPIQLWHLVIGLVIAILTPVIASAVTYGRRDEQFEQTRITVSDHDKSIDRLDRNIARIGAKLGVKDLEVPK